jgi:erythronate-4-phosphate dehydrogenase
MRMPMNMAKQKLHIVADENISGLDSLCADWATLTRLPGRQITASTLRSCDALLVRSVTVVDETLLADTSLSFVGSATIGTDHVDTDYLSQHNIAFSAAAGSNANAVVDYVMAAIAELIGVSLLASKRVGIVGCGNVGSRLQRCLQHFKVECIVYDPLITPLNSSQADDFWVDFDELLKADIISVHVPLTLSGDYPTQNMFNTEAFSAMCDDVVFINSSRGSVVDENALRQRLQNNPAMQAAIDVWQHEPTINTDLLKSTSLATPHIAGYSLPGKLRGSYAVVSALCKHFNLPLPALPAAVKVPLFTQYDHLSDYLNAVQAQVDIAGLSQRFVEQFGIGSAVTGQQFDLFRKHYPLRSEFNYLPAMPGAY